MIATWRKVLPTLAESNQKWDQVPPANLSYGKCPAHTALIDNWKNLLASTNKLNDLINEMNGFNSSELYDDEADDKDMPVTGG